MEKMNLDDPATQSADIVSENIERIKDLFPEAFIEGKVDFDTLRQLLGGNIEEREEKYNLNWHGKRRARQIALTPSTGSLRPCPEESIDWDTTQNLMIEGDNLEVLKLLQKSYAGRVKMIYIDPPYNTGKDFVYPDDFQDNINNYQMLTGQIDSDGRKISSNTEASGRFHTDWMNMMYPRLKIARNLLKDDGVIFVSINDKEVPRLRIMLEDIFGEENFLAQFSWRTDGNFDNQAKIKTCHEYVLLYAKSVDAFPHPPVVDPSTPTGSKLNKPEIRNTIVKNGPKNPPGKVTLPVGFPADFEQGVIPVRKAPWPIYHNEAIIRDGKLANDVVVESGWSSRELVEEFIKNGCQSIVDGKGQGTSFVISKTGAIEVIKQRSDYQSHVISVLNGFGGAQKASAQLAEIGAFFNGYPKPVDLIRYFIQMNIYQDHSIILDFFAGSGTAGHAVMEQNANDKCKRRYILVQLPEPLDPEDEHQKPAAEYCDKIGKPRNIAELTKERLRRAAKKVNEDNVTYAGDLGFRVFKLDSSNIRAWEPNRDNLEQTLLDHAEHIATGRSEEDILYELLLKLGLDLTVPIEQRQIAEKTVHSVGAGALLVCLSETIDRTAIEPLAQGIIQWHNELTPAVDTRIVFRDSAFVDDVAKSNLTAILQQHGLDDVRSL